MPHWVVSLVSDRIRASAKYEVEAINDSEAIEKAFRATKEGLVNGWTILGRSISGSWGGTPEQAWVTKKSGNNYEVSILTKPAIPYFTYPDIEVRTAEEALNEILRLNSLGTVQWIWEGLNIGGPVPNARGWANPILRETETSLSPGGTLLKGFPTIVPATVIDSLSELVPTGTVTVKARLDPFDNSPITIGSGSVLAGMSSPQVTIPVTWPTLSAEISGVFSGVENEYFPSQSVWYPVTVR